MSHFWNKKQWQAKSSLKGQYLIIIEKIVEDINWVFFICVVKYLETFYYWYPEADFGCRSGFFCHPFIYKTQLKWIWGFWKYKEFDVFFTSNGSETLFWLKTQVHSLWSWKSWPAWRGMGMVLNSWWWYKTREIRTTWKQRRWSQTRWWWRILWGVPWFLQSDWAEPPSWSSCLSQCHQRSPCQNRFQLAEELNMATPPLRFSFKIRDRDCII